MITKRRIMVLSGVFLAAAAAGHLTQNGGAFAAKFAANDLAIAGSGAGAEKTVSANVAVALPSPPQEAIMQTGPGLPALAKGRRIAALSSSINTGNQTDAPTPSFFQSSCDISLSALPETGAMVRLQLDAPCYRQQRITISHAGLEFSEITDLDGSYEVLIPVFERYAPFSVTFADGNSVEAKTLGLSLEGIHRVAISWRGGPGLHIHALEYGADFGEPGHVWAGATDAFANEARTDGGVLATFGNADVLNPHLAEVYTYPSYGAVADGAVRLIVEAEVTPKTCGTNISGKTLQFEDSGKISTTTVSLVMPECGDVGGFLVLNNLLQNMKIAQN